MSRKKLPYLNLFTGDYIRDTRILSPETRGIWMDLLCLMHDSDRRGYLVRNDQPYSVEELARFCTTSAATVTLALQELINSGVASCIGTQQVLISRRMVRDEQKRRKCVVAGKKGGNPALKGGDKGSLKPPLVVVVDSINTPPEEEKKEKRKRRPQGGAGGAEPDGWAAFWHAWPNKVSKPEALRAWKKLSPDAELQTVMLAALAVQKTWDRWTKDRGQYIPHPATWLNGRRWEDKPAETLFEADAIATEAEEEAERERRRIETQQRIAQQKAEAVKPPPNFFKRPPATEGPSDA